MDANALRRLAAVVDAKTHESHLDLLTSLNGELADLVLDRDKAVRACEGVWTLLKEHADDAPLVRGVRLLSAWAVASSDYEISQLGVGMLIAISPHVREPKGLEGVQ